MIWWPNSLALVLSRAGVIMPRPRAIQCPISSYETEMTPVDWREKDIAGKSQAQRLGKLVGYC